MISFTSILTTIRGLGLATKVGLGVGAVAVVAGGTAGTVAIINANRTHEETQIVANNPDDDNSHPSRKIRKLERLERLRTIITKPNRQLKTINQRLTTHKLPHKNQIIARLPIISQIILPHLNQTLLLPSPLNPANPLLQASHHSLRNQPKSLIIT